MSSLANEYLYGNTINMAIQPSSFEDETSIVEEQIVNTIKNGETI